MLTLDGKDGDHRKQDDLAADSEDALDRLLARGKVVEETSTIRLDAHDAPELASGEPGGVQDSSEQERDATTSDYRPIRLQLALISGGIIVSVLLVRVVVAIFQGDFVGDMLALQAPFSASPSPSSASVSGKTDFVSAMLVGAPTVIASLWLAGAIQIDRAARRALGGPSLTGNSSRTYYVVAAGCAFPLMLLSVVGGGWGLVNLISWAMETGSWGSVIQLFLLEAAFVLLVKLGNDWMDRPG